MSTKTGFGQKRRIKASICEAKTLGKAQRKCAIVLLNEEGSGHLNVALFDLWPRAVETHDLLARCTAGTSGCVSDWGGGSITGPGKAHRSLSCAFDTWSRENCGRGRRPRDSGQRVKAAPDSGTRLRGPFMVESYSCGFARTLASSSKGTANELVTSTVPLVHDPRSTPTTRFFPALDVPSTLK